MKKELDYFLVGNAYGGYQEWFSDYMMRVGGCAAVTACDCCIYFARYKNMPFLYPYNSENITKRDYISFSMAMKPYLRPRWTGIDNLDLYTDGFGSYLSEHNANISMETFDGNNKVNEAEKAVTQQIDNGFPVPCLILNHNNSAFKDYVWHWFLLTGYERFADRLMVKAVTYGSWRWVPLDGLWDTGRQRKGGLILFRET